MKTIIKKVIEENEPASSYIRRRGDDRAQDLVNAKVRDVVKAEVNKWVEKLSTAEDALETLTRYTVLDSTKIKVV